MQAHLVTAPGDGVAPAVLLSLPGSACDGRGQAAAQYLFNVPEGFSRLVLEHRLRPGAGLRAAFASDMASLAGFGGLVMRLRGEGHGQLHVVGPTGTRAAVCSLHHFIHWRHPAVLVEEMAPWEAQPTVYQDEHVAIAALWKPPLLAAMWPAPAWLLQPRPVQHAMSSSIDTSGHSSSSSEESGSSSGGISSSESSESESSRSESSECLQGSLPDAVAEEQLRWDQGQSRVDGASMFDALDKVFMEGGSSSRRLALEHLKAPHHAVAAANADAFGVAVQAAVARSKVPTKVAAAAAAAMSAAAAVPPRRRQQPAAGDDADDVAVVGGKRFQRLPAQAGINVWVCQKVATRATSATGAGSVAAGAAGLSAAASSGAAGKAQGPDHQQPATSAAAVTPALPAMHDQQVLAFVCHLRASDQLLLLTNLHSKGAVAQLQRHPALALLQSQGSRLAGVLHMAAPGVAGSSALRQLCHQLQPAVAAGPAAGQQLLLEQAGAHAGAQVIGHLAAARTNAKLHVVSSRIFPLPAGIQAPRAAQPPPASATPQSCASSGSGCGAADPGVQPSSAEHDGQQGQEQEESVGLVAEQLAADCHQAMAAGAVAVSSSASGVVSIRHVSLVTWKQRPPEEQPQPRQLASSGAAATGACPGGGAVSQQQQPRAAAVLVVEPGEGFADDAWCAASAVQQGRPLLVAALERLQEQQQRGLLPSRELSAAGAATWQCRQNLVGPPPPPPLPPTTAGPAQQPIAWPAGVAPQQPGAPPQQQQPTIMRPLYQHAPAAPHQPLLTQPMHLQPAPSPPGQLQSYRQPALAARSDRQQPVHHCSPPQLHPPPPRPPELPDAGGGLAANKRAADSIRARLQGGKRPRAPEGGGDGGSSAAGPQQPQQSLPPEEPRWLRGAPASICQLASGGAAGCAPEVVFLGTGSAEPSKYRGASAIQLRLPCGQSLLLDCGEGALGALRRAHGAAAAMRQVASLGCLWVSHRHADHMSGVASLLAAYPASLPPLLVVGPRSLRDWLAEAAPALRLAGRYRFVHCAELNRPDHWARQALRRHLGITHLQCVPVRHCSDAYGLVLQHEQGWSLVYSGDTQPCQQLVQAGRGCTLLIHEATFEPCLEQQARQKRHSTTAEALEVAQRMGAYRCILTHFSQRYPKWPQGLDQLQADEEARSPEGAELDGGKGGTPAAPTSSLAAAATAAVAFDGMRVPLALLPVLPALMPAVQAALADPEDGEAEGDGDGDTAGGA